MVDGGAMWRTVGRSGGRAPLVGLPGKRRCPMLMGTYTPKLDDKGRLFLPAKFRDQLSQGLVVTRGQERCLTVWPMRAFEQLAGQAQEAPVTDKAVRDYTRLLFAGASDDQPDKQGRLSIPPMLRD